MIHMYGRRPRLRRFVKCVSGAEVLVNHCVIWMEDADEGPRSEA